MGKKKTLKIIKNKSMTKYYFYNFIFIFFLISFTILKRRNIKKLEISGNERISNETIKVYGEIRKNKNYSK